MDWALTIEAIRPRKKKTFEPLKCHFLMRAATEREPLNTPASASGLVSTSTQSVARTIFFVLFPCAHIRTHRSLLCRMLFFSFCGMGTEFMTMLYSRVTITLLDNHAPFDVGLFTRCRPRTVHPFDDPSTRSVSPRLSQPLSTANHLRSSTDRPHMMTLKLPVSDVGPAAH